MMDKREIDFSKKVIKESIKVIIDARFIGESSSIGPKPLTIFFKDDSILVANMVMQPPKLTIEVPSPFPYMDNKMVLWSYNCNYVNESTTTNILGIEGMIGSGR